MSKLGHNRERQVKEVLEEDGYVVIRAAGSLGGIDLVASRAHQIDRPDLRFIEVKANREGGAYMNFRREERDALRKAAQRAGATAWLAWWPSGGKLMWIAEKEWPR